MPDASADSFDSDSSSSYTVAQGTAGTITGGAYENTDDDLILIHNCQFAIGKGHVDTIMKASVTGAKARLYGAYTDIDNYLYVELEYVTSTTATISLWKKTTAGGLVQISGTSPAVTVGSGTLFDPVKDLLLCWDGVEVYAAVGFGGTHVAEVSVPETLTGPGGGFGGDANGGTIYCYQIALRRIVEDTNGCMTCRVCQGCNPGTVPSALQVDISNIGTNGGSAGCMICETLNSTYVLDYIGPCAGQFEIAVLCSCTWRVAIDNPDCTMISYLAVYLGKVNVSDTTSTLTIEFQDSSGLAVYQFTKTGIPRPRNCNSATPITGFTTTLGGSGPPCDVTVPNITVTAL